MAFVACAGKAPITQKLHGESLVRIKRAGELENIQRWCSWTPMQLSLLELGETLHGLGEGQRNRRLAKKKRTKDRREL